MHEILRNLLRRKVRTGLTIFGIVIGVFALTVMGSMSEYFNTMVDKAIQYAATTITISPKEGTWMATLSEGTLRRIARVRGVKEVIPYVVDSLEEAKGFYIGMPPMVFGLPPEQTRLAFSQVPLAKGRWLERGDGYHAVAGGMIARQRELDLGTKITWRKKEFTVVGIMAETQTWYDSLVLIPLDTARRVMKMPDLIMGAEVVPVDPGEIEALAERINREVEDVKAESPQKAIEDVRMGLLIFNVIMLSGAVLAVVVGGLAVINTMVMSVHERTREIGVKKAVGAEDLDILAEYVAEAAVIGLVGGLVGLLLGWGMASFLNITIAQELGAEIFTVTPRLVIGALTFSLVLGIVAGLYPAWRAARLDPVAALRME